MAFLVRLLSDETGPCCITGRRIAVGVLELVDEWVGNDAVFGRPEPEAILTAVRESVRIDVADDDLDEAGWATEGLVDLVDDGVDGELVAFVVRFAGTAFVE